MSDVDGITNVRESAEEDVRRVRINPTCIASTSSNLEPDPSANGPTISHGIKQAQWSPDQTCVLTSSAGPNGRLSTYILPPELLDTSKHHDLTPYASHSLPETTWAFAPHPHFNLADPSTCSIISSTRDHPLRLTNALSSSFNPIATYRIINPFTEEFLTPSSFAFTADGLHVVSGCNALLAVHDLSRDGSLPVEEHRTARSKRYKGHGGSTGITGIISSLSINHNGTLAAGTLLNSIGLYASEGRGETVATFSIRSDEGAASWGANDPVGMGISQVVWSPCGNYLLAAGRKSEIVPLYDLRTGKRLCWLSGRDAVTNQRLGVDVVPAREGWEVWSGGADGNVRVWKDPHFEQGAVEPVEVWKAHDDPVTTTLVHRCGVVAATVSATDYNAPLSKSDDDNGRLDSGSDESSSESDEDTTSGSESSKVESSTSTTSIAKELSKTSDCKLKVWSI